MEREEEEEEEEDGIVQEPASFRLDPLGWVDFGMIFATRSIEEYRREGFQRMELVNIGGEHEVTFV